MFAVLCALLVLGATSSPAHAWSSDDRIRAEAQTAVNRYALFSIFDDVWLEVVDGHVTVGGKVTSPIKKHDIGKRVSSIAGVRSLSNVISVLPVSRLDDQLREQIARAIYGHASFWNYAVMPNPPIHIVVEHSRVTLTGVVRTDADRTLARLLALQSDALAVAVELRTDAEVLEAQ